jgi:predicted GNAT superfamily acetyltransferase
MGLLREPAGVVSNSRMETNGIEIRQLAELEEFAGVVRLQREIWGFQDIELLPLRLFVVADKIGGQVLGAFDAGRMVAFCLCIPGLKPGGKQYFHSHMLGVLPAYRNTGLGRRMKLAQREYALARGIDLIEWTFDPLELKNAFFNIERLGAIARRYVHNQYGRTSSHLHGGLPTDRLIAEWWIGKPHVDAIVNRRPIERPAIEARIEVPAEIPALLKENAASSRQIQINVGEQFETHFRLGLSVIGIEKDQNSSVYLLGRWDSK